MNQLNHQPFLSKVYKGIFITIEGIDGSGKSTLAKNLYQFLIQNQFPSILTKEPSDSLIGQQIRLILQKKLPITKKLNIYYLQQIELNIFKK